MNQPTVPPSLNGFGTLALTNASALISTVTANAAGAAYPGANGFQNQAVTITNSSASAGIAYVCPLGGTCSAAVGIPLGVGVTRTWTVTGAVAPTAIALSTASIVIEW